MGRSVQTTVFWTCDRCSAEETGEPVPIDWVLWGFQERKTHCVQDMAYCGKCHAELLRFVKQPKEE